jgi:hypothetical protein
VIAPRNSIRTSLEEWTPPFPSVFLVVRQALALWREAVASPLGKAVIGGHGTNPSQIIE